MNDSIETKGSKINGKGVFAKRDFKEGEIVVKWDIAHTLTNGQLKTLPREDKKYIASFNRQYFIMQPPTKYVNHFCDANTHVVNFCDVALRDIKSGEEITTDYSKDVTTPLKMKCNCGSKNCQGIIVVNKF